MPSETTKPTLTVSDRGDIAPGVPRTGYRQGLADLLDFTSPPIKVSILPPGAPTAIGFWKTGSAIRDAIVALERQSRKRV